MIKGLWVTGKDKIVAGHDNDYNIMIMFWQKCRNHPKMLRCLVRKLVHPLVPFSFAAYPFSSSGLSPLWLVGECLVAFCC